MHDGEAQRRARSFEQGAQDYDRLRPEFPAALFDDLRAAAGERLAEPVLEVGAGTGRATLPLARSGVRLVVVEPSADMLSVLRRRLTEEKLAGLVELRRAAFERVDPSERYAVVVAAQSFHWTDPATRWARLGALLGGDGRAFLFGNSWTLDPEAHDAQAVRALYAAAGGGLVADLPEADRKDTDGKVQGEREIEAHPAVRLVTTRGYDWPWRLPVADYLGLLRTTSQYAVADPGLREPLLERLGALLGETVTLRGHSLMLEAAAA